MYEHKRNTNRNFAINKQKYTHYTEYTLLFKIYFLNILKWYSFHKIDQSVLPYFCTMTATEDIETRYGQLDSVSELHDIFWVCHQLYCQQFRLKA